MSVNINIGATSFLKDSKIWLKFAVGKSKHCGRCKNVTPDGKKGTISAERERLAKRVNGNNLHKKRNGGTPK